MLVILHLRWGMVICILEFFSLFFFAYVRSVNSFFFFSSVNVKTVKRFVIDETMPQKDAYYIGLLGTFSPIPTFCLIEILLNQFSRNFIPHLSFVLREIFDERIFLVDRLRYHLEIFIFISFRNLHIKNGI